MSKTKSQISEEEINQVVMEGESKSNKENKGSTSKSKSTDFFDQIDDYLHDFLIERAPKLPDNVRETLVKFMPIINMISIVLTIFAVAVVIPLIFGLLGLSIFTSGVYGYGYLGQINGLAIALSLAVYGFILYFLFKAQPGLQPKKYSSWKNLVFAQLFAGISSILSFSLVGLFFNLIWLYFIYQIKGYYKAK